MGCARRGFLKGASLFAVATGLDWGWPGVDFAAPARRAPGVSAAAVDSFLDAVAASGIEVHSLVLARHGQVAAQGWWQPYRAQAPHRLYSLSKSFTSTAVGFAVSDGKVRLSDRVIDFFPRQTPANIGDHLAALRVEHLLTMSVGHTSDSTPAVTHQEDWVRAFLAQPIEHLPGSVFLYDSAATYMLSAIVQKVVGERLVDYLRPRLFAPLQVPAMSWAVCPRGINTGGWGLSATTQTLFKFGQFYLQKGRWNGRQLLPTEWIEQATRFHIQPPAGPGQQLEDLQHTSDWHQGYGYQFWRCRHNAFRGDGGFGQFCIALPEQDAVIAITSRTLDMQGLLNLVWEHLLPGLQDGAAPSDPNSMEHLRGRLAGLTLRTPEGSLAWPPQLGKSMVYAIESNAMVIDQLTVSNVMNSVRLEFRIGSDTHVVTSGVGQWHDGETELPGTPPEWTELVGVEASPKRPARIAAAGAWKDPDTFVMHWRYYETPHLDTVTLRFAGDRIEVDFLNSLSQMAAALHPETRPVLKGVRRS
jgi:CubicO group peptidase (beta-lactamase class C family)